MNGLKYLKNLSLAKNITLIVSDGEEKGNYLSSVTNIDDNAITIIAPLNKGTTILFRQGTLIEVNFTDTQYSYMFITRIIGRSLSTIPSYILELPNEIIKFSKRNYIRVITCVPIYFQIANSESDPDIWKKGTTKDISGGGLCFSSQEEIEENDLLNIRIVLPDIEIKCLARLCRIKKKLVREKSAISVEYVDLPERERDVIIRYVFYIQRNMLRKGLT